jgi:hypothetical protein
MRAVALVAMVVAALAFSISRAGAVTVGGPVPFGLTPAASADGQPRPYFQLQLTPGESITDTVTISDVGTTTANLEVSASSGITAPNSGSAFAGYFQPCRGVACWLAGLPARVTLAPGGRQEARFKVTVPAGTAPRQYLAGITAQPATPPAAVPVGSNGNASAKAVIVQQVTVGVAITVGQLSTLRTALEIPDVTAGVVGPTPRLYVQVHNPGQTFVKATGNASCSRAGKQLVVPITMDTVLPAEGATLPVNLPDLPEGTATPCTVHLRYGAGQLATWSGAVTIPTVHTPITVPTGPGQFSALPSSSGLPTWAIVVMALGALAVAALAVLAFVLLRRRHAGAETSDQTSDTTISEQG